MMQSADGASHSVQLHRDADFFQRFPPSSIVVGAIVVGAMVGEGASE